MDGIMWKALLSEENYIHEKLYLYFTKFPDELLDVLPRTEEERAECPWNR